jgi:hypothetical protein
VPAAADADACEEAEGDRALIGGDRKPAVGERASVIGGASSWACTVEPEEEADGERSLALSTETPSRSK